MPLFQEMLKSCCDMLEDGENRLQLLREAQQQPQEEQNKPHLLNFLLRRNSNQIETEITSLEDHVTNLRSCCEAVEDAAAYSLSLSNKEGNSDKGVPAIVKGTGHNTHDEVFYKKLQRIDTLFTLTREYIFETDSI